MVRYAAERQIAVVPFGAGSGVCGGTVPVKGGIALDLKRLSGPPAVDLAARTVDVEAGTNGQRLEELLGAAGATVGAEMTGTLPASGTTANISTSGNVDASLVTGISVVVS